MTTCETCGGDGEFLTNTGNDIISEPCPDCQKPGLERDRLIAERLGLEWCGLCGIIMPDEELHYADKGNCTGGYMHVSTDPVAAFRLLEYLRMGKPYSFWTYFIDAGPEAYSVTVLFKAAKERLATARHPSLAVAATEAILKATEEQTL